MHCLIIRETLASKTLGPELMKVIKLVNTVRFSALNTRLFRCFCKKMEADHYNLLYHSEVQRPSMSYVLKRVVASRIKLRDFFATKQRRANKIFPICCGITGLPC